MNELMKSGTGLEDFKGISDFIDLKMLQNILDNFARATGLSFVTVDHRGNPVTEYSGFCYPYYVKRQLFRCNFSWTNQG